MQKTEEKTDVKINNLDIITKGLSDIRKDYSIVYGTDSDMLSVNVKRDEDTKLYELSLVREILKSGAFLSSAMTEYRGKELRITFVVPHEA